MTQKREIRQLWDIATYYFDLATALKKKNKNVLRTPILQISEHYEKEIPENKVIKSLCFLVAHLSSASVRLCTIAERLKKDGEQNLPKSFKPREYVGKEEPEIKNDLKDHIHFLLRDNTGHFERGNSRWEVRQDVVESLNVEEIYNAMEMLMESFKDELKKRGFML